MARTLRGSGYEQVAHAKAEVLPFRIPLRLSRHRSEKHSLYLATFRPCYANELGVHRRVNS